ncbi:MAG: 4Fe-4S cluster-binding domain-containing protein, partial [Christensenellaceae bacterium]|nr:4Fe-4S cluster-binding domain-containing protein [Christensenellaceae bacterium]
MIHAGKFEDTYFILDVESGSLHEVDELTYEVAALMEQGTTEKSAILAALHGRDAGEIGEIMEEFEALKEEGLLFSACPADVSKPVFNKPVVKSLCLHIAHDCNLRCSYCFASEGTYMGDRSKMSEEVGKAALDFLMEQSKGRKHLEVDFFGGEPLINFGVVKALVAYGRELEKKHGKIIRFTLTTNAYHVTDEMIDFLNKEMKNLVISID